MLGAGLGPMPSVMRLVMAPVMRLVMAPKWAFFKPACHRSATASDRSKPEARPTRSSSDQEGPRTLRSSRMISWVLPSSSHSDTTLLTKTSLSSLRSLLRHSSAKLAKLKS